MVRLDKLSITQYFFLILVIGIATRVSLILVSKSYLHPEKAEVVLVAQSLAEHGTFSNPFCGETGLTAHVAPAYPFLLSLLFRVLGMGIAGEIGKQLLTSIVAALGYALMPLLATKSNILLRVGVLSGLAGALFPVRKWQETDGGFEMVYAVLIFMGIYVLTLHTWRNVRFDHWTALWNGLAWGTLILFAPVFLNVLAGFLLAGGIKFWNTNKRCYLNYAVMLILVGSVVLVPWTIRNYRVFGSFIPVRDNLGLELSISNGNQSWPTLDQNLVPGAAMDHHPYGNCEEAAIVKSLGEVAYNREKMRLALSWIRSHPMKFLELSFLRFLDFWFPPYKPHLKAIGFGVITLLGLAGGLLLFRRDRATGSLFFTIWLTYPMTFYFVQADGRYRSPIEWTFLLLAVYLVLQVVEDSPGVWHSINPLVRKSD